MATVPERATQGWTQGYVVIRTETRQFHGFYEKWTSAAFAAAQAGAQYKAVQGSWRPGTETFIADGKPSEAGN
jgi:hypothetical protein